MKPFRAALLALAAGLSSFMATPASAQLFAISPNANTYNALKPMVPVCTAFFNADGGLSGAGQQIQFRQTYYCPNGATAVSLLWPGFYQVGTPPLETSLVSPLPYNFSIVLAPKPWSATTTYAIGDKVIYNATQSTASANAFLNNNIYQAAAANTNSAPTPGNANWTGAAAIVPTVLGTCNATLGCTVPTVTTPGGTLVTQGTLTADPLTVTIPVDSFIEIVGWVNLSGSQQLSTAAPTQFTLGAYYHQAASETDNTTTNANNAIISRSSMAGPAAILGYPLTAKPTVFFIGDSRSVGINGSGAQSITLASGGSGYGAADEGLILRIADTGASANAVCRSAAAIITKVTAGAVAAVQDYDTGCYAGTLNGQSNPAGSQAIVGGSGTGAGVTATFSTSGFDFGDARGGLGYIQRILNNSGLAWSGAGKSGDTIAEWATRDYQRQQFIASVHASSVIDELDINDIRGGVSAATIEANHIILANKLLANHFVKAVYLATTPADPTSTDGYATLANQTAESHDAVRVAVNTWKRTVPAPFAGYIETADPVESSRNSGLVKVGSDACNAGNAAAARNVVMCDGLHFAPYGGGLIVTGVGDISGVMQ